MPRTKRHRLLIIFIAIISLFAVGWIDSLIQRKQKLVGAGFTKAFLFVLINLHIIAAGLLLFLICRQGIKLYSEHKDGIPGAVFKRNLLFAFTLFSIIPALFVFFTAGKFITANIDHWFDARIDTGLTSGMMLHQKHTASLRDNVSVYGALLRASLEPLLSSMCSDEQKKAQCRALIEAHSRHDGSVYLFGSGNKVFFNQFEKEVAVWRSFRTHNDRSMHSLKQLFLRELASVGNKGGCFDFYGSLYWAYQSSDYTLVVAVRYPEAIRCSLIDAQNARADYQQLRQMRNSIRLNYTFTFVLLTLLMIFLAIWCAFYLARGMAMPIQELLQATDAMHKGDFSVKVNDYPSSDLRPLLLGFNQMTLALQRSRQHLEAKNREIGSMIEHLMVAIIVLDRFGRIIKTNPAADELARDYLGTDSIMYKKINIFGPQITIQCRLMVRNLLKTRQFKASHEVKLNFNNQQHILMLHVSTIGYDGQQHMLVAIEDISTAVKANKLKTWQEAAQQIAHEIKNPLTPIQLATQRLQRRYQQSLSSDPLFAQSTQTILEQVKIIQDLVNHFSAFASMPKLSLEKTNLLEHITDIVGFYTLSYQDIEFLCSIDQSLTMITDKKKLTRALVNILDNSVKALSSTNHSGSNKCISITALGSVHSDALSITIADNGPGIDKSIKDKLFLPYVSGDKKNMGLGLAIVQDIVQQLNGTIIVLPKKNGAAFSLTLPRVHSEKIF